MIEHAKLREFFTDKNIMVTGGLGSIGSAIIDGLLSFDVRSIKVIDNRETELFYASKKSTDKRLKFHFADIRDKSSLRNIIKGTNIVFHAAAMKHVIICEKNPDEAIKTNVLGTQNIIELCTESNVDKMILISTDKAVTPEGVMGTTKLLAEKMISAMHNVNEHNKTKFGAVRFGNVLYSRGSVLEIWAEQLEKQGKITITNYDMTRFFMGIPQSVELILMAAYYINNAEIFIMKMPSCSIRDLSTAFLEARQRTDCQCEIIGINKGDKMHEKLLSEDENADILENEKFLIKLPLELSTYKTAFDYSELGFKKSNIQNFSSNNSAYLMDKDELKTIIEKYVTTEL